MTQQRLIAACVQVTGNEGLLSVIAAAEIQNESISRTFQSKGLFIKSHNWHGRRKGWYTRYLVLNVIVYASEKPGECWRIAQRSSQEE